MTVNNTNRSSNFINSTTLQVALTTGDVATAGTLSRGDQSGSAAARAAERRNVKHLFHLRRR